MPDLSTADGRRAWALLVMLGGCMVMTVFAAVGVYLLRAYAGFVFWLTIAAHIHILLGLTGIATLFVRRTIRVDRNGIEITDKDK